MIVCDGKGGIYREVPLHHAAKTTLRVWLDERPKHRGAEASRALFLSRRGDRIRVRPCATSSPNSANTPAWCRIRPPARGPIPGAPHTLRHSFGTQLLRNGVDIVTVADLVGYATLDTTRTYTDP